MADKTGRMTREAFYLFSPAFDDVPPGGLHFGKGTLAVREPTATALAIAGESYLSLVTAEDCRPISKLKYLRCKAPAKNRIEELKYPLHTTEEYVIDMSYDVEKGTAVGGPFIESSQGLVITNDLRSQLLNSTLRGWASEPIIVNQGTSSLKLPSLNLLRFLGRNCERSLKVDNAINTCPHCGRSPVVCDSCQSMFPHCPICGGITWTSAKDHKGKDDKRLVICPPEEREPLIMDGYRWDGSDFCYFRWNQHGFISRRALNWLLSVHAAPFYATPIDFCTDGMTDQQRRWLDEVMAN